MFFLLACYLSALLKNSYAYINTNHVVWFSLTTVVSLQPPGGGGTTIYKLCEYLPGMVFRPFSLVQGIEMRPFWSRIGYNSQEKRPV